jgi:hypothetical protein
MRLIIAVALLAIALATGSVLLFAAREEAPDALIQAELAGVRFQYARAYGRDESTAAGGLSDHLGFIVSFPKFAPLSAKERPVATAIALTLTPKDEGLNPGERPAKLYARFLTPETLEGPGGLILRHFEQGSPYDSEELFIAPPDGRSFFARCPKADARAPGEACLSMFREGGMDVELRYPPALLGHWDAIFDGAHALIARMTARKKTR